MIRAGLHPAIRAALLGGPLPPPRVRPARIILTESRAPTQPIVFVLDREAFTAAYRDWARGSR